MKRHLMVLYMVVLFPLLATAQNNTGTTNTSTYLSNPLFIGLLSIIIILALTIIGLAEVVKAAAKNQNEREKLKKQNKSGTAAVVLLLAASFFSGDLFGQNAPTAATDGYYNYTYWGLNPTLFYCMVLFIFLEIAIILVLYTTAIRLLGVKERREAKQKLQAEAVKPVVPAQPTLIDKLNDWVPIEQEKDIMFDHEYDGIRELDNNLPPWWKWGFYISIFAGVVYMFHFHILKTGNLQKAEYDKELAVAKADIAAYKKKAANLVDETNVVLLTEPAAIEAGKSTYMRFCVTCHGKEGQGDVGPNMTDNYWIHGGGISDVFKSIKFGWPEKGMKSWQQDLGARQMQEVVSYLKTLVGTNPPNPKEKEGELYIEAVKGAATKNDSLKKTTDSMPVKDSIPIPVK